MSADTSQGSIIYVEGVTVSFDGFKALDNVNFIMGNGEFRVVIGPNGAGKSTLLDVITGKVKPDSGRILFKDRLHNLADMREPQIANMGIGRKFQTPTVFDNLTVHQNLELALKENRGVFRSLLARLSNDQSARISEVMDLIDLSDEAHGLAGLLAHGQKQWLEIGMLVVQDPQLMLVDEPAAGMTDRETKKTGELLLRIAQERSVLVIDHDMDFVRQIAQTVTVLHEGKVLCEGPVEKVQADPRVKEVYLGRE